MFEQAPWRKRDAYGRTRAEVIAQRQALDPHYFPARRSPWPFIGVALVILVAGYAVFVWRTDTSTVRDPNTKVSLSGSAGMSERDLNACMSFHAASINASNLLDSSRRPEGVALAKEGAFTSDIIDGYLDALLTVGTQIKDAKLKASVDELTATLQAQKQAGSADMLAGTPTWGPRYADVSAAIDKFAAAFEARCAEGGVMVKVGAEE